jgi:hypothetical protein
MTRTLVEDLVEIRLKNPEDFLKIRETLTRIGVAPKNDNRLYQSCHILHKQKRYYIVHFKELLGLDGKSTNFSDEDRLRRNTIVALLEQWSLVEVVDQNQIADRAPIALIKIIPFKDKANWTLHTKYNIGHKRVNHENKDGTVSKGAIS